MTQTIRYSVNILDSETWPAVFDAPGVVSVRSGEQDSGRCRFDVAVQADARATFESALDHSDVVIEYSVVEPEGCECGEITGVPCEWSGEPHELVRIEHMPQHLRASHEAAGNRGRYPDNGAVRLRVSPACADMLIDGDGEWTSRL